MKGRNDSLIRNGKSSSIVGGLYTKKDLEGGNTTHNGSLMEWS